MKRLVYHLTMALFVTIGATTLSCANTSSTSSSNEKRNHVGFTGVDLATSGNVYITQGEVYSIVIEAEPSIIERIKTEVRGSNLRIYTERSFTKGWKDTRLKIYITMPNIESFHVSGSGSIEGATPIESQAISMVVSGSGNVTISNLSVDELSANISGSGSVRVSGAKPASSAKLRVSGSGSISTGDIVIDQTDVAISGSGNVSLTGGSFLKANVSGSGNVSYAGNPRLDVKVSGSGRVKSR